VNGFVSIGYRSLLRLRLVHDLEAVLDLRHPHPRAERIESFRVVVLLPAMATFDGLSVPSGSSNPGIGSRRSRGGAAREEYGLGLVKGSNSVRPQAGSRFARSLTPSVAAPSLHSRSLNRD
jgi:hypothetical protein